MSTEIDEAKRIFLAELAESGISQEIALAKSKEAGLLDTSVASKGTNFRAQHFSLFALPTIVVYMQGIMPVTYPIESLQVALLHSRVRRLNYKSLTLANFTEEGIKTIHMLTGQIESGRFKLFSDAEWHKGLVTQFATAGGTVTANATSKALALEKLAKYNEAALAFLALHGITTGSGSEYLSLHTKPKRLDPSAEFDW